MTIGEAMVISSLNNVVYRKSLNDHGDRISRKDTAYRDTEFSGGEQDSIKSTVPTTARLEDKDDLQYT